MDQYGNIATGYTGKIHFTSSDPLATAEPAYLSDYTFTTGPGGDNGMHVFSATLKTVGTQSITATDTSNGTLSGAQSDIVVVQSPATSLVVSGFLSPTTAGVDHQFTVTAYDANGHVAAGYTGTVHFTSSDAPGFPRRRAAARLHVHDRPRRRRRRAHLHGHAQDRRPAVDHRRRHRDPGHHRHADEYHHRCGKGNRHQDCLAAPRRRHRRQAICHHCRRS